MPKINILKLREYVLWYGKDLDLSVRITKYLVDNGEQVYNHDEAIHNRESSSDWTFWRYCEEDDIWTRSSSERILNSRPKSDLFLRRLKLQKLEKISKKRR